MNRSISLRLAFGLACAVPSVPSVAFAGEPSHDAVPRGDYTLHEWGTFTTVSASDGALLPGVEREEEALPGFVYAHEAMHNNATIFQTPLSKGISWHRPLANVTVRMETPVIYFYTKQPFTARVEVGFKGGTISQWYPQRTSGEELPALIRDAEGQPLGPENTLDFTKERTGSIVWDVKVEPAGDDAFGRVFRGGETPSWLHPRQPDSAIVTTKSGESEKYLFYRGLGRLEPPVMFTATDASLTAVNCSPDPLNHWIIFDYDAAHGVRWTRPAPVAAISHTGKNPDPIALGTRPYSTEWRKPLYEEVAGMLTAAGLTRAEADGMIQTWWSSYFEKPGVRVFWVVPSSYVDSVLPLKVTPAPRESVRVIVGRSEIMTPAFERQLLADFAAATEEKPNVWLHDRYFPAYAARVKQLSGQTAAR